MNPDRAEQLRRYCIYLLQGSGGVQLVLSMIMNTIVVQNHSYPSEYACKVGTIFGLYFKEAFSDNQVAFHFFFLSLALLFGTSFRVARTQSMQR